MRIATRYFVRAQLCHVYSHPCSLSPLGSQLIIQSMLGGVLGVLKGKHKSWGGRERKGMEENSLSMGSVR